MSPDIDCVCVCVGGGWRWVGGGGDDKINLKLGLTICQLSDFGQVALWGSIMS